MVKLLLSSGCDVDLQSERNRTALHMAVWSQRLRIVRILLDANCELDLKDRYGDTALMLAARKGHLDIMQVMITLMRRQKSLYKLRFSLNTSFLQSSAIDVRIALGVLLTFKLNPCN